MKNLCKVQVINSSTFYLIYSFFFHFGFVGMKILFSKLFYYSGIFNILKKVNLSNNKFILMFHGVSKSKSNSLNQHLQPHLDIKQFENIIKMLNENYCFLKPDEIFNNKKKGILLTFDDGFQNNYNNVIPILNSYNIPGLFFISTQHVIEPNNWLSFIKQNMKKYMVNKDILSADLKIDYFNGLTKDQIIKMANNPLHTIGSHTVTHPDLTKLSVTNIDYELINSKNYLENITNKPIEYFAYPYGNYNKIVIENVKKAGYKAAFGIDKINFFGESNFEIPRIGIYDDSKYYITAKLSVLNQKSVQAK